jgi:hypothetical protein
MQNSMNSGTTSGAARRAAASAALLALALLLISCAAEQREIEQLTTSKPMTDIAITDLHEEPTDNAAFVNVVGTIVNHGAKPVSQLSVRVDVMDTFGQVLDSVVTPPLAQTIAPNGGQAQFSVRMSSMHLVTYKAFAIAR